MLIRNKRLVFLLLALFTVTIIGFTENFSRVAGIAKYLKRVFSAAAFSKEQVNFNGPVKATQKGKTALGLTIRQLSDDSQMIVFLGRLTLKGRITPNVPGTAIPTQMRLVQRHKDANNRVVATQNYDFNVQSDGAILTQNLPVTLFDVYSNKESQELAVVPVDLNLPACRINLKMIHTIGVSAAPEMEEKSEVETAAAPELVFLFNNFMEDRIRNQIAGPWLLKNSGQAGFVLNGTVRIKGKITPDDPLPPPSNINVTVKHKNAQSQALISTQSFTVRVEPDGRIDPEDSLIRLRITIQRIVKSSNVLQELGKYSFQIYYLVRHVRMIVLKCAFHPRTNTVPCFLFLIPRPYKEDVFMFWMSR